MTRKKNEQGTGHTIQCCATTLTQDESKFTIIVSGDVPLLKSETM